MISSFETLYRADYIKIQELLVHVHRTGSQVFRKLFTAAEGCGVSTEFSRRFRAQIPPALRTHSRKPNLLALEELEPLSAWVSWAQ